MSAGGRPKPAAAARLLRPTACHRLCVAACDAASLTPARPPRKHARRSIRTGARPAVRWRGGCRSSPPGRRDPVASATLPASPSPRSASSTARSGSSRRRSPRAGSGRPERRSALPVAALRRPHGDHRRRAALARSRACATNAVRLALPIHAIDTASAAVGGLLGETSKRTSIVLTAVSGTNTVLALLARRTLR